MGTFKEQYEDKSKKGEEHNVNLIESRLQDVYLLLLYYFVCIKKIKIKKKF